MSLDHISKKAESIRNKKPKKRHEFKLPQILIKRKHTEMSLSVLRFFHQYIPMDSVI